jgi:class 3 adenylate cyclase/tetratricopeptide (TPR) repeat protein
MQCPQCQHENPGGKFCGECGARLELRCPACGEPNPPGNKFCQECGERFAAAPTSADPVAPSPVAYTPHHLAERIISSRGALEGERKQVTVLFADLKGSMELLADRDPEEARRILDPVLERMMEAVHRYEGTVNQVMGDGIMALFGAPIAHEDHAVRSCYAALRMQEAVKDYAQDVQRLHGLPLQIRVGLNSGEVVVRSIGSDLRMDYTAVGQTTHLAARMEQMAMPGSILLAPDTLQLAEGYLQVKPLGPVPVKGLSEPVEAYELLSAGTARSRLQAAAARGLTKFVGRDAELETLRRTLGLAAAGHGQLVALVGEPGVGKSRLVWEFSHSHRTQGWLVLDSRSVSYGKATSYLPVIDLLKSYCGIEDRDDPRRIREKLTGKVLALDPALQGTLPALLALLDVPADDAAWQALDPPQRRQRTLDACKRLLVRESQEQPLLLVFEDLHWIDSETQALLDSLVDSLPAARLLLLVNYRPEYEHTWHRKTYYQQLRLDPLPPASAEELLTALLGDAAELQPLRRLLVERTEGNPFFVEETVRALIEAGTLAGERGAHRLAKPLEIAQVPATVQAVLAARVDRLAPEAKRLLQAAAVIGKDVPYALLRAIAELREDWLRQSLADLQTAEFLYERSLFPDLEYTFKHALTHEVAYGSVLHDRRRALHARIVDAIETLYADRLAEHLEGLAHHALRGQVWDKAVLYLQQASQKAAARSAHQQAITYCEQALGALGHLPETRETRERAFDIWLGMRPSFVPLGQHERIPDILRAAESLAEALGDPQRRARVDSIAVDYYWQVGQQQRALDFGLRALVILQDAPDLATQVVTNARLGRVYAAMGDYPRALRCLSDAVAPLQGELVGERFDMPIPAAEACWTWMAWCLAERGEFTAALARSKETLDHAETFDQAFGRAHACLMMGLVHVRQGNVDQASAALHRGISICEAAGISYFLTWITPLLAHAHTLAGRVAEAILLGEQAIAQARATNTRVNQGLWRAHLGEAYLGAGRWRDALGTTEEALALAREQGERGNEAWALRLLGEIVTHADPPNMEQAKVHYCQALALADELGMRPLAAHCHLGLGTLYQRVGRDDEAQGELGTATEMYRAMEMTLWLAKAQAALARGSN